MLEISTDKYNLADTYNDWEKHAKESLRELEATGGLKAVKVEIDVEELLMWCQLENREVNGAARSAFAAYKIEGRGIF